MAQSTEIQEYLISDFHFVCGVRHTVKLAYRSFNQSAPRVALIPTCFGQRINEVLNFAGGALSKYHVIVVGMFGGGESSSPSNDADFPSEVRYEDCVNAQYILITQHFELKSLDLVLGSSMGAQQAWYWAAMHGTSPGPFLKRIAAVVGSAQISPHCIAFLEGATQAMISAVGYSDRLEGIISACPLIPVHAFAASFCAWTTSPEWYRQEQWKCLGYSSLWDYLRLTSQTLFAGWHPHDLICLVRMWQHGDIATLHPPTDLVTRLSSIESHVLVIPSRTDQYFVHDACAEEARHLKRGRLVILDTVWGHIGGGGASQDDAEFLDGCISNFLHSTVE